MQFNTQPINLFDSKVILTPLAETDFEQLYSAASDPLIWKQHPNPNRYKRDVFENYFKGALKSGGAFLITHAVTGEVIGCSRFYDFDEKLNRILIGYTFLTRKFWGGEFNTSVKTLMLNYAFKHVASVHFHIGAENLRSQKAIERLGAIKVDELQVQYYGETNTLNFVYEIIKKSWVK